MQLKVGRSSRPYILQSDGHTKVTCVELYLVWEEVEVYAVHVSDEVSLPQVLGVTLGAVVALPDVECRKMVTHTAHLAEGCGKGICEGGYHDSAILILYHYHGITLNGIPPHFWGTGGSPMASDDPLSRTPSCRVPRPIRGCCVASRALPQRPRV